MTAIRTIGRFAVDICIMFALTFLALIVYTLYTQNPEIVNALYCTFNTDTDLGYTACMVMHN